jgi:nitrate reductase gamma subunit
LTVALYVLVCAAALTFVAASAARALKYARLPVHLRWELYPVPHEEPERARYGGSYFELSEWWRAPRRVSLAGDLKFMIPEMLFLRALRESNRPLWFRSFPFHFGLYLLATAAALLLTAALATIFGWMAPTEALSELARWSYTTTGAVGLLMAGGGAIGLLHRRVVDPALKVSTTSGDIANLLFFVGALGLIGGAYLMRPPGSPGALAISIGLLTWDTTLAIPVPFGCGLAVSALLVAYIPLTHMSHFIAKYFTYHRVRWDDAPAADNRRMAAAMAAYLAYKPTWSAAHMGSDGAATWADIAASNPARGEQR